MADGVRDKASLDHSRRNLLKTLALGAGVLAMPGMLRSTRAQAAGGDVILRSIPKTGEKLRRSGSGRS